MSFSAVIKAVDTVLISEIPTNPQSNYPIQTIMSEAQKRKTGANSSSGIEFDVFCELMYLYVLILIDCQLSVQGTISPQL